MIPINGNIDLTLQTQNTAGFGYNTYKNANVYHKQMINDV